VCRNKVSATNWIKAGGDYTTALGAASFDKGHTGLIIDLNSAVAQAWINRSATNYGMLLKVKETGNE
jgi:hypothetical protein